MVFRAVKSTRIYHDIACQIKHAIEVGEFCPGDQLPSERDLAEMFGVGRTTVREALRTLETEGLVIVRHGQGTFIAEPEMSSLADHFAELITQNECTPAQVLEARCGVEVHLARLAALKREPQHIEQLQRCLQDMEYLVQQGTPAMGPDQKFHLIVAQAAKNLILLTLFENIVEVMQRPNWIHSKRAVLSDLENAERFLQQHHGIFTAIKNKQPNLAEDRMLMHLESVYRSVCHGDPRLVGS